jgi:histidine kinase
MRQFLAKIRKSLVAKLILSVGIILVLTISTWSYFSIAYQRKTLEDEVVAQTERLTNTIKLGTHYAMMLNSRDDINQIITNIGKLKEIEAIRIYNKEGAIKFSNRTEEVEQITNIKSEACHICHHSDPPLVNVELSERLRYFAAEDGGRRLGVISPIHNEPGCSTSDCHFHPPDKKILGALDVVVTLAETEREIRFMEKGVIGLALGVFAVTSAFIFFFVLRFVNRPIRRLIEGAHAISRGDYSVRVAEDRPDEMGQLGAAINFMCQEIGEQQTELNRQRDEYQVLFNTVPCIITVQDRSYRLIGFNREFADLFAPKTGDFCYEAYKGRSTKCVNCPVEKTFRDGQPHYSEESGVNKDGTPAHWIVKTSPIRNAEGEMIAAMEVNLDITHRKRLEEQLEKSEKKYHEIFNSIPNPVFVLDAESLEIRDCNDAVPAVYGYARGEILHRCFAELFPKEEQPRYVAKVMRSSVIHQARQVHKDGRTLFVDMWISPAEYPGRRALLVTTSDITKRLEAEQQLIQASKMATLGEMATGVAHELNQPLAVIKTASRFFIKKIGKGEPIAPDTLKTLSEEIDSHVDRASKIISHMREFGRKVDKRLDPICLNDVLRKSFDIFRQQLKSRGIEVVWSLEEPLPDVRGDANRLEQVFINLLINARDAIEAVRPEKTCTRSRKTIYLTTRCRESHVQVEVRDTGCGIPNGVIEKIFEPFFTTKEVGKGTGLGLSISYQIVQDFGGSIRAVSPEGEGAAFILSFPRAAVDHDAGPSAA